MAKEMSDLFEKTDQEEAGYNHDKKGILTLEGKKNKVKGLGVGLMAREWEYIDEIAQELGEGVTGHAVAVRLLRDALRSYYAGEIKLETKTTQTTRLV